MSKVPDPALFVPPAKGSPPAGNGQARDLDKFYTNAGTVRQCIDDFQVLTDLDLEAVADEVIEPSAGAGAFLAHLPENTLAYDLAPESPLVIAQDFLTLDRHTPAIVIGNPPFGKSARLAIRFFNHAAGFASHIGFILPRTFQKASVQNRLDRNFHLVDERVLDPDSFTFEGAPYSVPCVFQVWARRDTLRPLTTQPRVHADFDFVTRSEADFAFQRVGVRAGTIKPEFGSVAATSHHFLRANADLDIVLRRFRSLDFSEVKARTAGNPSISKTEIVALYSEACDGG